MLVHNWENKIQYIPPHGAYETFRDEDNYKEKLKEWGLSSAKEAKKEFWYKERNLQIPVSIKGFETYGNLGQLNTIIIEFPNGNLSCIHPAFLKEMQQASFGKESFFITEEKENKLSLEPAETKVTKIEQEDPEVVKLAQTEETGSVEPKRPAKPKKEKAPKLALPEDKVHFIAAVKQFALTYNAFNEENDEVVVLENVEIVGDNPLEMGVAWCSHSKTLKKFSLAPGDSLEFDGKVVAKKLAKGKDAPEEFIVDIPVLYKINNPSKITKN